MAPSIFLRVAAVAALAASGVAADGDTNTLVTADGERVIAGYFPSIPLAAVGIALFGLSTVALWWHWFRTGRKLYMLTLTISMACMTLGFILRIVYQGDVASLGRYIAMYMFILLSPCAFLANNYLILSRLSQAMGPEAVHSLFLPAHHVGTIFIWSDVITFLLQAAGGGLTASNNADSASTGKSIALAGLAIQLASYCLFTCLLLWFGWKVRRIEIYNQDLPFRWSSYRPWGKDKIADWRPIFAAVSLACIGVLIRSFFRIVEYSEGYYGTLATEEGYFYGLDALPLWLAMSLYVLFFPPRFIEGCRDAKVEREAQRSLESGTPIESVQTHQEKSSEVERKPKWFLRR
ncbi:RTA1 domain-containing protein [Rhodotorula paludigena]|uniref:RTA1 domain-containing protein n=1 Tax=Rhodotorula paludigena TaxID=86838 RepID=UPI0031757C5A